VAIRNKSETALARQIMDYCDEHDIIFVRHHPVHLVSAGGVVRFAKVRESQKGAPDLFIHVNPSDGALAVETKSEDGTLLPSQKTWRDRWVAKGGRYIVPRTLEEFIDGLCGN